MWFVIAVVGSAWADTVVLDDGTVLRAHIVTWKDDCTLAVDEGPLADAWVVLPCARIAGYTREPPVAVVAPTIDAPLVPLEAAVLVEAASEPVPAAPAEALPLAIPYEAAPASPDPEDQPLVDPSGVVEEPLEPEVPVSGTPPTWRAAVLAARDRIRDAIR